MAQIFREKTEVSFRTPRRKKESEAFHWLRKDSQIAKYVLRVNFSYRDGFDVTFAVPADWSPAQLSKVIDGVQLEYHCLFMSDDD